jgi:hypothetical protein
MGGSIMSNWMKTTWFTESDSYRRVCPISESDLQAQIDRYLASGKKIEQVAIGASTYDQVAHTTAFKVISAKECERKRIKNDKMASKAAAK